MAQTIWTVAPSAEIIPSLERVKDIEPAIGELAVTHAARAEGQMKEGAPWNDITGYARGALYGRAEGTDIELGTTNAEYGLFLERGTSKMAPRPIIVPTAQAVAPDYFDDAGRLVMRAIGGG